MLVGSVCIVRGHTTTMDGTGGHGNVVFLRIDTSASQHFILDVHQFTLLHRVAKHASLNKFFFKLFRFMKNKNVEVRSF